MANQCTYNQQTFSVGDTINVSLKITEGDKTRIQVFTGLLIAVKGRDVNRSITVRKIAANNIGVERILPLNSPDIESISLKSKGRVRRAKLYYLRQRIGRSALRVKSPLVTAKPTVKTTSKKASKTTKPADDSANKKPRPRRRTASKKTAKK